jgi:hypothetical protein
VQAAGDDALPDVSAEPKAEVTAGLEVVRHVVAVDQGVKTWLRWVSLLSARSTMRCDPELSFSRAS